MNNEVAHLAVTLAALAASVGGLARGQEPSRGVLPALQAPRVLPASSRAPVDDLLRSLEQAYGAMDVEAFVGFFTDDFEMVDVGRRVHVQGKAAWRAQTGAVNSAHRKMSRRHFGRVVSGSTVIAEVEWSGTVKGEQLGGDSSAKTGEDREYRYPGLVLMEIRGGKIRRQIVYSDERTLREQLGFVALEATARLPAPPQAAHPPPGRLIDVGGHRLHIHCLGRGSPTVIVEGGVAVWSIFYDGVQRAVQPHTRVCTYDRAGLGWSDRGPLPRTASRITAELDRLLTAAGETGPFVLVGHSFGGLLSTLFAKEYPARTAGLVLVESAHEAQWQRLPRTAWDLVIEGQTLYRQAAQAARAGGIGMKDVPAEPFADSPGLRAVYVAFMRLAGQYEGTADELDAMSRSFEELSIPGNLGTLPLAVVTARNSFAAFAGTPIPRDSANAVWWNLQLELTRRSGNTRHLVSESGDHNIVSTDPSLTVTAILDVVERVRAAQAPPNLTGTWVLQADLSDLGSPVAPTIRADVIDHKEPRLAIRRTIMGPVGESTATLVLAVDGKPHKNRVGPNELTTTLKWEGAALIVVSTVMTSQQGEVTITDRVTLSPDGTTMTMARHLLTDGGQETHQRFVFVKQGVNPPSDSVRMAVFELFLGPWNFPPNAVKTSPQLADFYARNDAWGPRRRTIRLRETVHRENPNRLVFEGFAYWHPVDDKIRFTGYNVQQKFFFEGEFPVLEPRRIVQEYSVHYPRDLTFTEYPEMQSRVRRYLEERRIINDSTMVTTLQMLVEGRWVPWPSADAKPFVITRARGN